MLIDVDFRTEEHRLQFMNLQQTFFNYSSLKTFIDRLFYSVMIVLYQQTKYIDDFNNKRCDKQQDQLIIVLVETQLNNLQEQRDGVKNDLWDYYKLFLYPEYCDDITKENRNDITERFYISLFNEIINNQQFKDYLLYQSFLSRSTIAIEEYTYQDYKLQQQNTDSDMLAVLSSTIYNISKIFLKCIKQQSPIPGSNKNQEQQLNEILNII